MRVLKRHVHHETVLLDPFCGRGTTLFAARKLGLEAWGVDSSPVAVAIARAKLVTCKLEAPIELAAKLIRETVPRHIPESEFFRRAYSKRTLQDICALREGLLNLKRNTDAAIILRAAALGCLHGPLPRNLENAGYFSNQMPRTYASKPNYAVRFWKENSLVAPDLNVLRILKRKIDRLSVAEETSPSKFTQVLMGDSQKLSTIKRLKSAPNLVVTSPPYYGMRTYVQDQWLRNWFLGGSESPDYAPGIQLKHNGQEGFAQSLGKVWNSIATCSAGNLEMYVRFGIIPSADVDAKKLFRASLSESGFSWREISVRNASSAEEGKRQADQMRAASTAAIEFDFHVELKS